tara:strand:- start:972 stop:1160 length:189 start_codon:yes stop_codon:yes gene_type:complete
MAITHTGIKTMTGQAALEVLSKEGKSNSFMQTKGKCYNVRVKLNDTDSMDYENMMSNAGALA